VQALLTQPHHWLGAIHHSLYVLGNANRETAQTRFKQHDVDFYYYANKEVVVYVWIYEAPPPLPEPLT